MKSNIKFSHVGFPKCGSTFLQAEVFDKLTDINAITVGGKNCVFPRILPYITYCKDPFYDQKVVNDALEEIPEEINGISNEGFTSFCSPVMVAERLKETFGKIKILIVIRNQKAMVLSHYLHDIKIGYASSFEKWLDKLYHSYRFNFFKYSYTIDAYQKQFGEENVKVVLFEELFNRQTIEDFTKFIGVKNEGIEKIDYDKKVNAAFSPLTLALNKKFNRHFGTKANQGDGYIYNFYRYQVAPKIDKLYSIFGGSKKPEYYNNDTIKMITEWYHDDNQLLNKKFKRDLTAKGYL